MKLNKILRFAAVSALTVATGMMSVGCTDDFEDLNTDPYELNPDRSVPGTDVVCLCAATELVPILL